MRKIVSLAAVSLLITGALTGCASNSANGVADAPMVCKHYATGSSADALKFDLPAKGKPTLTSKNVSTKTPQTKVLVEGKGPLFGGDQQVRFDFAIFNAATGKMLNANAWDGTDSVSQVLKGKPESGPDFCASLAGLREGSVAAAIYSAKDSHAGKAVPSAGIGAKDSLVFVFSLDKVYLPKAIGDAKPAQDGFPQVVTDAAGVPGLVMQNWDASAAPKEFKREILIEGKGPIVKENEYVTVHYSGFVWSSAKTKFDSSWESDTPATFQLKQGALIPGFIKALDGVRVGSQVVAILPPSDGYGASGSGSIPANSTLIFVIDVLAKGK